MRHVVIAVLAGCAAPRPAASPADLPVDQPTDHTRHFTLWLGGARVGTAVESERWNVRGLTLSRTETVRFLRGETEIALETSIVIDADHGLQPQRVTWRERGLDTRGAEASRHDGRWTLSTGAALPADAVPAELVPLLVRRDHRFSGPVFLPARGFIAGRVEVEPVAPDRLVGRMSLQTQPVALATIDLDPDGNPARVVDGDGVIALRTSEAVAREPFAAVDLVAATAIPITGGAPSRRGRRVVLATERALALPPLPGQHAHAHASGIEVELSPSLRGELPAGTRTIDRLAEIQALVASVQQRITPDLGAGPVSLRDADDATAGDCTTFALAYTSLAAQRGITTRVVTGLRVDDGRLIRHRWAVSWTGTRWIAIDVAFGQVPAGGDLIGLAVHDAEDAGLLAGEAALAQVRAAAWAD